jgi:hypothetical protein
MRACLEEKCLGRIVGSVARTIAGWFVVSADTRQYPVSVVKLGTLRYPASTAKLTDSQQRDVVTYNQGKSSSFIGLPWDLFVEESRKSAFKSGEQCEVLRHSDVNRRPDPIHENVKHRGQKFLNNELRTVVGIDGARSYSI